MFRIFVMMIVFLSSFCIFTKAPKAAMNKPAVDKPRVILEEIKLVDDKKQIIVPVKIEAKIQSLVGADIEGHVIRILKPLGSKVSAQEIILYIENKDPSFTYAKVPVRSPISGVLSQVLVSQMAKVNRGDKLFAVIDPKSLKITAELPSSELAFMSSGLMGKFKMDNQPNLTYPIKVVGISPLVDSRTGTASAEFEFINSKKTFPPIGSVGQAFFETSLGSIILIPEAALVFKEGKPMVRILNGTNQFSKKRIELGDQRDEFYVVKDGVKKGEKIIVRSSRPLKDGEQVEVESPTGVKL